MAREEKAFTDLREIVFELGILYSCLSVNLRYRDVEGNSHERMTKS